MIDEELDAVAAKYRHPLTCWILSPEDNLEPIDFRIRSLFSLAVSATSQQDGDPYHPEVEYYYNETADKREPNWDHFLEPQSTTSLCCLVAWTDRASQGLPLCLTIEMCDLSSAPDSVLFQDSSLTQRFWNEHILKKELKIPRTSKHIWPHLDQAFLVLRLTQVETLYFHSIPSWSHDVLQSKFIEHWNGEAVALYSCLPFLLRSLISNVDEYDPEPLAQNHIAEGRELQYPPALRPTMLLFEKEFAECDSHQLLIRRSGCGSNESANIMSSTTSANKIPTIIGSSHNSAYCSR
ncbi:hypothetical protein BPOR_0612g00010 [Botrytis porri]|uniref:Uncharacterized protein n=1 Tax=Botrytis porri TaxID=87229 RepID=A0A4Z1KJB4_9HELO|nr:hypothetical protein BPOR_0612g00010 [Botrytis porri]